MVTASPRRAPGMFDVARSAGVSHQTVSRVVNDHPNVRPETRARVLAVIEQLGYRRNSMARALATNRSGTVGVITNREALYGPTSILLSLEAAARDEGYFVSLVTLTDASTPAMSAALQHFQDQAVEGIIVISASADFMTAAFEVAPRVPVVLVAATSKPLPGFYFASVDNDLGARLAVRHLLDLGHTDIAHVRGPKASLEATARMRSWRQTVRRAGHLPGAVIAGDWTAESGYAAGRRFLESRLPHAIFASNDEMALGVLRALTEKGVRVPDDVSLIGFDDIAGSAFFNPPLSTVRQDFTTLGHQCLDLLVSAMTGTDHSTPVLVEPTLLVRQSTAARRS